MGLLELALRLASSAALLLSGKREASGHRNCETREVLAGLVLCKQTECHPA